MSGPDEYKKPTFAEITRIGVNERGENIYMNEGDKQRVADHEKRGNKLKGKEAADKVIKNKKLPPRKPMKPPERAKPKRIG
jgi:hypothetical protein